MLPSEQAEQWTIMAKELCRRAGCSPEPLAEAKLKKSGPRSDKRPIPVPAETCLAFVDRSDEVRRCDDELDPSGVPAVLPFIVVGTDRDWPQALALRLQALAAGNTLHPCDPISIDWPTPRKRSIDDRLH